MVQKDLKVFSMGKIATNFMLSIPASNFELLNEGEGGVYSIK